MTEAERLAEIRHRVAHGSGQSREDGQWLLIQLDAAQAEVEALCKATAQLETQLASERNAADTLRHRIAELEELADKDGATKTDL